MPAAKDAIKDVVVDVNINFAQITVLATKKEIVRTNNEVTTEVTIIVLCIYLHIILIHLVILNFSSVKSTIDFLHYFKGYPRDF